MTRLIKFFSYLIPHRHFSKSMSDSLTRADQAQAEARRTLKNYRLELVQDSPIKVKKRNANPS